MCEWIRFKDKKPEWGTDLWLYNRDGSCEIEKYEYMGQPFEEDENDVYWHPFLVPPVINT